MIAVTRRECRVCGHSKPITEFYGQKGFICKNCKRKRVGNRRQIEFAKGGRWRRRGEHRTCEHCGKTWKQWNGCLPARYCSRACYNANRTASVGYREVECRLCGIKFSVPSNKAQTVRSYYCSTECCVRYLQKEAEARSIAKHEAKQNALPQCELCGHKVEDCRLLACKECRGSEWYPRIRAMKASHIAWMRRQCMTGWDRKVDSIASGDRHRKRRHVRRRNRKREHAGTSTWKVCLPKIILSARSRFFRQKRITTNPWMLKFETMASNWRKKHKTALQSRQLN